MASSKVFLDTSLLPVNLMMLQDDDFYDFIKQIVGSIEAELLQVQLINNVNALLMTKDVFEIMHIQSKELDDIKNKVGFKNEEGLFIIKAGVKGNIEYLVELLRAKTYEDKRNKNSKIIPALPPTPAPNVSQSSIILCSTATPINVTTSVAQWTIADHEKHIVDSIQRWCNDNKENLHLKDFTLTDGKEYRLTVKNDLNGTSKARINCDCGKLFPLTNNRGKFQMSNYYRHLKAVNPCKVVKEIKNNEKLLTLSTNTQSSSIDRSSTAPIASQSLTFSSDDTNRQQNASTSSITLGNARAKRSVNSAQSDSASSSTKKRRTH